MRGGEVEKGKERGRGRVVEDREEEEQGKDGIHAVARSGVSYAPIVPGACDFERWGVFVAIGCEFDLPPRYSIDLAELLRLGEKKL